MSFEQGLSSDCGIGFELVPRLKILREVVEFWETETIFKREMTMEQKHSCVLLRVATNALFMVFPVVHDVCYVKGRLFATFLSWGSLGHLILRAVPRGMLGGSSEGT